MKTGLWSEEAFVTASMEEECADIIIEILKGRKLTAQGIIQSMDAQRKKLEKRLSYCGWAKQREKLRKKIARLNWNPDYVLEVVASMEKKGIIKCVKDAKVEKHMVGVGGQPIVAVKRDFTRARFCLSRTPNQPA